MSRLSKKLKKITRKLAPIAITAGLGFIAGPAGVGVGQRILGGLGRIGKTGAKLAAPVVESLVRGQEQQAAASPEFDQQDAATPPQFRQPVYAGRLRPRFGATLQNAAYFPEEEQSMSLLGSVKGAVLPGAGILPRIGRAIAGKIPTGVEFTGRGLIPRNSAGGAFMSATDANAAFMRGMGRPRSKRINPTNVKALRRALRRVEGFVKLEKRVDKILRHAAGPARQARRSGFVKSRRR